MGRFTKGSYTPKRQSLKSPSKKETWEDSESRAAEMIDGKLTIASGRLNFDKGDFKNKTYRGECKHTDSEQMIFKTEWLRKISGEANSSGKTPLFFLSFGSMDFNKDWVMMEKTHFEEMFESHEPMLNEIERLKELIRELKDKNV